jgi:hypothetical protein
MALQRCFQLDATSVSGMSDVVRRALCDKDPSVMGATLHILFDLCKIEPTSYKDLVPSFVSILKQIIGMCVCVRERERKRACAVLCVCESCSLLLSCPDDSERSLVWRDIRASSAARLRLPPHPSAVDPAEAAANPRAPRQCGPEGVRGPCVSSSACHCAGLSPSQ